MSLRPTVAVCLVTFGVALALASPASAQPAPPATASASATAPAQVTVSWMPSAGATGYNVYRSFTPPVLFNLTGFYIAPDAVRVATGVAGPSWIDTSVTTLTRYYYAVTAVNGPDESDPWPLAQAAVMTTAPPNAPIWGIADTHSHQFSNLGFGETMFFGKPYDPGGISVALPWCTSAHGPGGLGDLVGMALNQGFGHLVGGNPQFDGWPRWNTYTHQQMYIDWLERAFVGGVKLVVVHAVNNEVLCGAVGPAPGVSCNDMQAVDRQLQAAQEIEANVPWYRIAHSAAEARQIINSGRLAVVLGIEVDYLFDCRPGGACTPDSVKTALKHYYDLGVRHIHPIHVFDNAFGGAALYDDAFNYGNRIANGVFFTPRDCSADGYRYKVAAAGGLAGFIAGFITGNPATTTFAGDCNATGLTSLGQSLINKMMSRKMIIDLDHLSALAAETTLQSAQGLTYPAIVAGHTGFIVTSNGTKKSEGQKTDAQVNRIRDLGGLISPILHQGTKQQIAQFGAAIPNDCSNSDKTWAQAYLYAVSKMNGGAVGLGSDFNGLAGQPGPRFGGENCPEDDPKVAQSGGVTYPFAPFGKPGSLDRSIVGSQSFDFNEDGLAHVGMIPDMVEDLRSQGLTAQLDPLFRSAEAYITMWAAAEAKNIFPPSLTFAVAPAPNAAGWNRANVTLTGTGVEHASGDGWPVQEIDYSASGAQPIAGTSLAGNTLTLALTAEGATTVTGTARDDVGNVSPPASAVARIDKTAPSVTCGTADSAWHASDVVVPCTASDATSGLANAADAAFTLSTTVPAGTETNAASTGSHDVYDVAGNMTTAGPIGGHKIDKKAPAISITSPTAVVYILNQPVAATYACTDGGSGVASCAGPVASGSNFTTAAAGVQAFTVNASDQVGNLSSSAVSYTVAYNVCLLYDPTKAKQAGSTIPIRLQLCDFTNTNVSSAAVTVTATGVTQVSTSAPGVLEDSGNANPDNNFRYDATLGAYVFNLKTTGYATGTYRLALTAMGDPTVHTVEFQVK